LLTSVQDERREFVRRALASDSRVASWALRRAEASLGRTVNRAEEESAWLSNELAQELDRALESAPAHESSSDAQRRLPRLARKLREANDGIRHFDEMLQREKLDSLKELAYGASHEINNPLANIAARAQTLLADEPEPARRRTLLA